MLQWVAACCFLFLPHDEAPSLPPRLAPALLLGHLDHVDSLDRLYIIWIVFLCCTLDGERFAVGDTVRVQEELD